MIFNYSKENLSQQEAKRQRLFEIIPGASSWFALISLVLLSILFPFTAAIIITAFYLAWFMRLVYMTIFLVLSYLRLDIERPTDWIARVQGIDRLTAYLQELRAAPKAKTWRKQYGDSIHLNEIQQLHDSKQLPPHSKDIYHLVIFPVIKEGVDIIEPALSAVRYQLFPCKQMVVIFALEDRAEARIKEGVNNVCAKYKNNFLDCFAVLHPGDTPGEARVKGANVTYAAKAARAYFEKLDIKPEQVICSCFDSDTVVEENYFTCLTYQFMVSPNRLQASFQPVPLYHNNIWHVPGFARVIESGSSFCQLIEATNPEKLVTFSSHSMSFKALVDADYWPVDMISDDSAIFWKCYIHYDGKYQVIPIYVTLSMDVVSADNWWQTAKNAYKQKRRWAWGVENFPLVMRAFIHANKIPLWDRFRHGFKLFEGHFSWATWGFILSLIGPLPIFFAKNEFAASVVYYNVPDIAGTIFNLGFLCLIVSIFLSIALLPKTPLRHGWLKKTIFAFEWLLLPIIVVFLSAMPALDAQTRLMRGRYLEFWVTDKKRK